MGMFAVEIDLSLRFSDLLVLVQCSITTPIFR